MTTIDLALPNGKKYSQPIGLFINNKFVSADSGKKFDTINPSTGQVITNVHEAGPADVDKAVKAAQAAFEGEWSDFTPSERGRCLNKLADLIEQDLETLGAVESFDGGKVQNLKVASFV